MSFHDSNLQMQQQQQLDRIEQLLVQIGDHIMALDLTGLNTSITKLTSVVAGTETLLTALSDEIKTLSGQTTDPATQAQLDAMARQIDGNVTSLSAAIVANTPAAPTP